MEGKELWKPVSGMYAVSDKGRVKNIATGNIVAPRPNFKGYGRIRMYAGRESEPREIAVHRLVACAFIPNPENKPQIDHINGNKADNRVENLRWVTNSENMFYHNYFNRRENLTEYVL